MGKIKKLTPEEREKQRQNQLRLERIIERRLAEEQNLRGAGAAKR